MTRFGLVLSCWLRVENITRWETLVSEIILQYSKPTELKFQKNPCAILSNDDLTVKSNGENRYLQLPFTLPQGDPLPQNSILKVVIQCGTSNDRHDTQKNQNIPKKKEKNENLDFFFLDNF